MSAIKSKRHDRRKLETGGMLSEVDGLGRYPDPRAVYRVRRMADLDASADSSRSSLREKGAAVLAFLVMVAYWPGTYAPALTLRWAVLLVGLPLLAPSSTARATALHWLGFSFLAYAALSLLWTPFPLDGIYELGIFALLAGGFLLGGGLDRCGVVFGGAAIGLVPSVIVGLMQWSGAQPVMQLSVSPSGLFVNANLMGEAAALVLVGAIAARKPLSGTGLWPRLEAAGMIFIVSVTALALLLSHHRTSMIALAIAGMIYVMKNWLRGFSKLVLLGIGITAVLSCMGAILLSITTDSGSFSERLDIWRAVLGVLSVFGHGAGSFQGLFPLYFMSKAEGNTDYAHNDLLQLGFEYGITALIPALVFVVLVLRSASPMRYVLIVFGIQSCAEFPLYMPATGFLVALVAGHCGREWRVYRPDDVLGGRTLFGRACPA